MNTAAEPIPRLAFDNDMYFKDASVIGWKESDWNWLAMYKQASYSNPELYRQIYKNYLRWYKFN